ncbi:3-hydroxyacyl-CoA dehydrogenase family protein [Actinoplanes sp. NPDC089786]|uniref:3-hydroxyacyl-CoA dehydrogenase family protein n=1 Tax=Actinoplanes sp. NPDC089786 TaxID=3155185 RepID=UPI0034298069
MTDLPGTVGVIGGGRMGAGIAQVFAAGGSAVTIVERDPAAAAAARDRVAMGLHRAAAKETLPTTPGEVLSRVSVVDSVGELAPCELVVEAVPEDLDLKRQVLAAVGEAAVLATNTSSLSIGRLASAVGDPSRVIGMHFFNPVPVSDLVELVVGPATAPAVVEAATSWVGALGKTAICVRDTPGFATSRLGVLLGLEAIRMVSEGVASPADIDKALELGYGHPMGPLRTTDLVGLDVRLAIASHLHAELGDRFAPPQLLRDKVARGELGRKTGQGFFTW